jgi:hypothetical protein
VMGEEIATRRDAVESKRRLRVYINKHGVPINRDSEMAWDPFGGGRNVLRWDGEHAARHASCTDCAWLRGYQSWWCKNALAVAAHRTAIPAKVGCRFWSPCEREAVPLAIRTRFALARLWTWLRNIAARWSGDGPGDRP